MVVATERIALGTAQFGLPYGIANRSGQVRPDAAREILDLARTLGVDTLDTAIAYGASEATLGSALVHGWSIVTKLPAVPDGAGNVADWVEQQIAGSLNRLGVDALHGLLLHRPLQLLEPAGPALFGALRALRERGIVRRVGYSIYSPCDLDALWSSYPAELVQAPLNVLDRRMLTSGWAQRLAGEGVELHTRSAFLQGLLLSPETRATAYFQRWAPLWQNWERWLADAGVPALQACLQFVLGIPHVARVVVGVDTTAQLAQILAAANGAASSVPDHLVSTDPALIDPSRWPR